MNKPNASQILPEPTNLIPSPIRIISAATAPHIAINLEISNNPLAPVETSAPSFCDNLATSYVPIITPAIKVNPAIVSAM